MRQNKFQQTTFDFEVEKVDNKVEEELKKIDPLNLTPMEAMKTLYDLVNEVKEKDKNG